MPYAKFLKQIGRNIKAARARAELRQIDVEEKTGLTYRHYQSIEAGKVNVSVETLWTLSKLFNVKTEEFFREE